MRTRVDGCRQPRIFAWLKICPCSQPCSPFPANLPSSASPEIPQTAYQIMSESNENQPQGRYDQYTRFSQQPASQQTQYGPTGSQAIYGQTPRAPAYPGPLATAYKVPPPPGSKPAAAAAAASAEPAKSEDEEKKE